MATDDDPRAERFAFAFDPRLAPLVRPFGARPGAAEVVVDDRGVEVRFGRFRTAVAWDDVAGAEVSGPYRWYRVVGPRLSLADRGATFGSSAAGGVCLSFHRPVAALFGRRRVHPGLTVTVADPDGLRDAVLDHLRRRG